MKVIAIMFSSQPSAILPWVALYVGPDLILPLTSALAAVMGVVLMFWQRVVGAFRSTLTLLQKKKQ